MKTILILVDSVNRRFLNCYGAQEAAITPNLDRLAARSTIFDNHYCGSSPCMPARRDIMTGRLNFLERPWGGIEAFDHTVQSILEDHGVFSCMITERRVASLLTFRVTSSLKSTVPTVKGVPERRVCRCERTVPE